MPRTGRYEAVAILVTRRLQRDQRRGAEELIEPKAEIRCPDRAARLPGSRIRVRDRGHDECTRTLARIGLARSCIRRRVGENSGDEGRASREVPGELSRIEVVRRVERKLHRVGDEIARDIARDLRGKIHAVVCCKEPEFVPDDEPTEVDAEVRPSIVR